VSAEYYVDARESEVFPGFAEVTVWRRSKIKFGRKRLLKDRPDTIGYINASSITDEYLADCLKHRAFKDGTGTYYVAGDYGVKRYDLNPKNDNEYLLLSYTSTLDQWNVIAHINKSEVDFSILWGVGLLGRLKLVPLRDSSQARGSDRLRVIGRVENE